MEAKPEGLNPATWMLEISTPAAEERASVDFTQVYNESGLKGWAPMGQGTQLSAVSCQNLNWPHNGPD